MNAPSVPLLEVGGLHAGYGMGTVLHDVSLSVSEGAFVTVVGANTAGKSTLLRAISGLLREVRGTVRFRGEDLRARRAHEIPALGIAHVPEGRHVFPDMSVQDNLLTGAWNLRAEKVRVQRNLDRVLQQFPRLAERRRQLAGTLSGGEQQMVAIGRALMAEPVLLLLDEPSHGLAPKIVDELHRTMLDIHAAGVALLLVEQNTRLALSISQSAWVLESGRVVLQGPSQQLLADPAVRKAYLGI